jgi:hypothetical protein
VKTAAELSPWDFMNKSRWVGRGERIKVSTGCRIPDSKEEPVGREEKVKVVGGGRMMDETKKGKYPQNNPRNLKG